MPRLKTPRFQMGTRVRVVSGLSLLHNNLSVFNSSVLMVPILRIDPNLFFLHRLSQFTLLLVTYALESILKWKKIKQG